MSFLAQAEAYDFFGRIFSLGIVPQIFSFFIGSLIGSYLNVVIYRTPLGISVNKPARSFCPGCKKPIPWYRNIPLLTWLIQRGKCAGCQGSIPVRYFMVELLTACLFLAVAVFYPSATMLLGWLLVALLVSISFIDGEHYIIPVHWCWIAAPIAIIGGYFWGGLLTPEGGLFNTISNFTLDLLGIEWSQHISQLTTAILGFIIGYLSLALVVIFGKIVFGKKTFTFDKPEEWFLKEPQSDEEQLQFVLGSEALDWGDVFYRPTDRINLIGQDFKIDGKAVEGTALTIHERKIIIGGQTYEIEEIKSVRGRATNVVIPREAMGGGDPPFLAMIGAFIGPVGVLFTIFSSCIFAITAAILGRVGLGRPLPYGPFLALGGLTWIFGGYHLFQLYLDLFF